MNLTASMTDYQFGVHAPTSALHSIDSTSLFAAFSSIIAFSLSPLRSAANKTANVVDVLAAERKLLSPSTSMDAALDRTMDEGATGPTHMSHMAREMDTEAQQEAKYKRFLDSPLATTLSADKGEEEDGEKQKSKL